MAGCVCPANIYIRRAGYDHGIAGKRRDLGQRLRHEVADHQDDEEAEQLRDEGGDPAPRVLEPALEVDVCDHASPLLAGTHHRRPAGVLAERLPAQMGRNLVRAPATYADPDLSRPAVVRALLMGPTKGGRPENLQHGGTLIQTRAEAL